jgi:hypothetical protein
LNVGDTLTVKSIQDTQEQFYNLRVVGISDNRQFSLQPSVFVPISTWDEIRPQAAIGGVPDAGVVANVIGVQVTNPAEAAAVAEQIERDVKDVVAVDRVTAYEATPGYSAQPGRFHCAD